jgi:hypothetical protein
MLLGKARCAFLRYICVTGTGTALTGVMKIQQLARVSGQILNVYI